MSVEPAATPPPPARPRKGGVVVPRSLAWHQRWLASILYLFIRAVAATLRCRWEVHPEALGLGGAPVIFAVWHNRLFLSLIMYERFARRTGREAKLAAMVSASRDGGMVARILEHFGAEPVRGSSSRRGPQALLELTTWAERGFDLAITPDGPRGPCYVVQPGAVALAHLTGLAVVPASFQLSWKFSTPSWDKFQVPLPFSRCVMKLGEPILIPQRATDGQREHFRAELERRLKAITVD